MATIKAQLAEIIPRSPEHGSFVNSYSLMQLMEARGIHLPFISWSAGESGRGYRPQGWHVVLLGEETHPEAHWTHYGNKFFYRNPLIKMDERRVGTESAITWANEKYGTTEWTKISGFPRDLFPVEVLAEAKRIIKEAKAKP